MKLEDQVASLELSKRLKELGVKQESYFRWRDWPKSDSTLCHSDGKMFDDDYSAFTVAELGEILPDGYVTWLWRFGANHPNSGWHGDRHDGIGIDHELFNQHPSKTEADARARMLIYLIENKLVTP